MPLSLLSMETGQNPLRRDWKSRVFMRAAEAMWEIPGSEMQETHSRGREV